MAITDMPERFTLGEVEIALEVKRIRFMHQSVLVDEISNIIRDPRGGMGQRLQLGRLREIVIFAGVKSLRMKGPSGGDPALEGWKTVNMPNSNNPYAEFPDYEDDEYAKDLIRELLKRILTHNHFIVDHEDFGELFRGYLPKEQAAEPDPTPSPERGATNGADTSTDSVPSTSDTPNDQETPPTPETTENSVGSMT